MPEVKYDAEWGTIKIVSAKEIPLAEPRWAVISNLLKLFGALDPEKITYEASAYEIKLVDGRKWNQGIFFADPPTDDPEMTFTVSDRWTMSEFRRQRDIRDWIIAAVVDFGLTSFRCTWSGA